MIRNQIAVARGADLVVVRVAGTGNMITAPALNDFAEAQQTAGFRRFVFDLAQCRGLDSTFMGCMVGIYTALKRDDGSPQKPAAPAQERAKQAPLIAPRASEPQSIEPMSREEALSALQEQFNRFRQQEEDSDASTRLVDGFVIAVNVSPECGELMNILGVDKFVKVLGSVDLSVLETIVLPEKQLPPDERRRLILKAHETLVEIDKRNEAQFGAFLRTLSAELAKENSAR